MEALGVIETIGQTGAMPRTVQVDPMGKEFVVRRLDALKTGHGIASAHNAVTEVLPCRKNS